MDTVIAVNRLRRAYGDVHAVHDVTFSVARGEIFGLLGPNGAGKTTTVECLQGLRARDGGAVEVLGLDPARNPDRLRRRIGAQLQSAALPDRLRVSEAMRLFARLKPGPVDVDRVLDDWDLARLRRRAFATLSGGRRQRLFLALALLGDPEIVFLDELTAGLDPAARRATWELVRRVRDRGATVVLVTHFMEEAHALCDRVAIIDAGRVAALDSPTALTLRSRGGVRVTFSANGHDPGFLARLPDVTAVTSHTGHVAVDGGPTAPVHVAAALAGRGIVPHDYRTHHPTLEDAFLALTGRSLIGEVSP